MRGTEHDTPDHAPARRRAALALVASAAGILFAWRLEDAPSGAFFSLGLLATVFAAALRARPASLCMLAALALLMAGWTQFRTRERPADALEVLLAQGPSGKSLCTIEAIVLTAPRAAAPDRSGLRAFLPAPPSTIFTARVYAFIDGDDSLSASGRLWVTLAGEPPAHIRPGTPVRITGLFDPPAPPLNPGEPDRRALSCQSGFAGSIRVSGPSLVLPAKHNPGLFARTLPPLREFLRARARTVADKAANGSTNPDAAALIHGLLLGEFDDTREDLRDAFARQGLAHVLSVSGFHVAVMAGLALFVLRIPGEGLGRLAPFTVGLLVLLYTLIVPANSPILRAGAMVLALLASEALGRRYDRLTLMLWIALALLVWRPLDLFSISWQLTVGMTGLLFWQARPFADRLFPPPLKGTIDRARFSPLRAPASWFKDALSAALLCWVASAPWLIHRIGLFSPLAVPATLLATPIITLLLWIGYAALLLGMFIPPLAEPAAALLVPLASAASTIVRFLDSLALSSIPTPAAGAPWAVAATMVLLAWLAREPLRSPRAWLAAAVLAGWLAWSATVTPRPSRDVALRLDTFAVGDGTFHLVRSRGDAMLWDCGVRRAGAVRPLAVSHLRAIGVWRVPTLVITHPDIDHFVAALDVIEPLGVRRVLTCERFLSQAQSHPRGAAAYALHRLNDMGVDVRAVAQGHTEPFGEGTLAILSPPRDAEWESDNDHSLVGLFRAPAGDSERTLLLTGDAQRDAARWIESYYPDLRVTAAEAPHHGSPDPAAVSWLLRTDPRIVVQSTGPDRIGDPRLDRARAGRTWFTTASDGAVFIEFLRSGHTRAGPIPR